MAHNSSETVSGFDIRLAHPVAVYWVALLRVITGWWFFHSGLSKLLGDGLNYTFGWIYLRGMGDTVLGPLATWMGYNFPNVIEAMVPIGELLIGLGLLVGALVRLASLFGMFFMSLFWVGNADFGHGLVNGDLMGLLMFATMIVLAAGRYYGLDAVLEQTQFVRDHPRLRYLMG
jgi:thiosulfate dehydrogenase [quinone] large subunit